MFLFYLVDAPTNIQTEVHATQCVVMWDFQRYVREYQITYSKTSRQSVKLMKVSGDEENVSALLNEKIYVCFRSFFLIWIHAPSMKL